MPFKLYIYLGAFVTYCDPILVISKMPIYSTNPIFDYLLESSHLTCIYPKVVTDFVNINFFNESRVFCKGSNSAITLVRVHHKLFLYPL